MWTGATIIATATFGGIGAGLAAILFSGGNWTGAVWVGTTFLGGFWHDGLLQVEIWYQNGTSFDAVQKVGGIAAIP